MGVGRMGCMRVGGLHAGRGSQRTHCPAGGHKTAGGYHAGSSYHRIDSQPGDGNSATRYGESGIYYANRHLCRPI